MEDFSSPKAPLQRLPLKRKLRGLRMTYVGAPPQPGNDVPQLEEAAFENGQVEASRRYEEKLADVREEAREMQAQVLGDIMRCYRSLEREIEENLPEIVMAVVRKIWGGLELDADRLNRMIDSVLNELSPQGERLEIAVSPADYVLLKGVADGPEERYPDLELFEDRQLSSGDVRVRSRFGNIDARIETKLKRIEGELRGEE